MPARARSFVARGLRGTGRGCGALAVAAVLLGGPTGAAAQPRELPATIVTVSGHAETFRTGATVWGSAGLRDQLMDGDGARTLAGRVTLRTQGGQALRLAPHTQVFFSPAGAAGGPTRVRMDAGRLWVSVWPNSPAASQVEVQAGPALVTVQAGGSAIAINPDGSVLVAAHHGSVVCTGAGWQRTLAADQSLLVPAAGAPKEPVKLKPDKRDADWIRWNEQQDQAGGYGGRRPSP